MKTLILSVLLVLSSYGLLAQYAQYSYLFELHGQKRIMNFHYQKSDEGYLIDWQLRRNKGQYLVSQTAIDQASGMQFLRGENDSLLVLEDQFTLFHIISKSAYQELMSRGKFVYNQTTYMLVGERELSVGGQMMQTLHVKAAIDETEMWIMKDPSWPVILQMKKNPLGINFQIRSIKQMKN